MPQVVPEGARVFWATVALVAQRFCEQLGRLEPDATDDDVRLALKRACLGITPAEAWEVPWTPKNSAELFAKATELLGIQRPRKAAPPAPRLTPAVLDPDARLDPVGPALVRRPELPPIPLADESPPAPPPAPGMLVPATRVPAPPPPAVAEHPDAFADPPQLACCRCAKTFVGTRTQGYNARRGDRVICDKFNCPGPRPKKVRTIVPPTPPAEEPADVAA
jgi:hypothetical protein